MLHTEGGTPQVFLRHASAGTYHDPTNPQQPVPPPADPTESLLVLADPDSGKYLTADYDLLAIGPRTPPELLPPRPDAKMGFITPSQITLVDTMNKAVTEKGRYRGGNVVHHGPENQFECSPGTDFPNTVFEPDGSIRTIPEGPKGKNEMHLKRYFQRQVVLGWHLTPNPLWNWGADGRPRTRDQIIKTGWPDQDGKPIKPPKCEKKSDDNDEKKDP
jgi:hypothetical protein